MIAYDELATALERWRLRQGLPATPPLFADGRGAAPAALPRATQAIAAAPPPPAPAPAAAAQIPRTPPPPPSGRSTLFGMQAASVPPAPVATAAMAMVPPPDDESADLGEADVLEETGDQYDNEGNDFALAFGAEGPPPTDGDEPTRASGDAGSSADGWPEARTVSTYGWGQATPARTVEVDDADEATHISDPTRHD